MIIADLEIHSRYARACSKELSPLTLNYWAKRKGVNLLSSGDITHPLWRREMERSLIAREPGFFVLKEEAEVTEKIPVFTGMTKRQTPRFVLGGEVSLMFRQGELKGRRVHVLFFAPSFAAVERLVKIINPKAKLASDGRPILGMSCRDFAKACLEADEKIMIIPAHIWTPWFGLLGSKSGFDSIEEAFEDQADRVLAYETGLSADPSMCWRVETLNKRVMVSSSDLHSGPNMMREATLLNGEIADYSYDRLYKALSKVGNNDYYGTLEFFPQEGKYHADGHAACKVVLEPDKTKQLNGLCPVCGRPLTVGVNHRVTDLAGHPSGYKPPHAGQVIYSVPLQEIIAEALQRGKQSKAVQSVYDRMVDTITNEYNLLHQFNDFPNWVPERVVKGIQKVRRGEVFIEPGYDGIYGRVRLFENDKKMISLWEV
jgi:DNA helicase II / ATP-dependent DNA helicase PcrA